MQYVSAFYYVRLCAWLRRLIHGAKYQSFLLTLEPISIAVSGFSACFIFVTRHLLIQWFVIATCPIPASTDPSRTAIMTSVLSLSPHLSLTIPYRERAFERSWSSLGSGNSTGTVQYLQLRRVSTSSVISGASLYANSWQGIPDHTPPHRNSAIGLPTRRSPSARKSDSSSSSHARSASAVPFSLTRTSDLSIANLRGLRFSSNSAPAPEQDGKTLDFVYEEDSLSEEVVWHDPLEEQEQEQEQEVEQTLPLVVDQIFKRPIIDDVHDHSFRRWMSTIRKRKRTNRRLLPADVPPVVIEASSPPKSAQQTPHRFLPGHRKSDSLVSSLGFVTAVKSASITIASTSMASFSRYTHTKSPRSRRFANNSANSGSDVVRKSIDSVAAMDEAAMKRSRRRREKVEELIRTEEGYLNDLKALCNVTSICQWTERYQIANLY